MTRSWGAIGATLLLSASVLAACGGSTPASTPVMHASAPVAAATAQPTAPPSDTVAEIAALRARLAASPDDAATLRDLGLALLQRVRETADPSLYAQAEKALTRARDLAPDDPKVLVGIASL